MTDKKIENMEDAKSMDNEKKQNAVAEESETQAEQRIENAAEAKNMEEPTAVQEEKHAEAAADAQKDSPSQIQTTTTTTGDMTEIVISMPADGDEELDDELLQELTQALTQLLEDTGDNAKLAIDYIVGITEGKQKISRAKNIEDFEDALVENIVLPVARSAKGMPNPNDAIAILMTIDDKALIEEVANVKAAGLVDENVNLDEIDFDRMNDKFIALCTQGVDDAAADAALNDVVRYHLQKKQGKLPDIPRVKFGFFKKLKMARNVIRKQAKMLRTMLKQAHNRHDIEIWYSRYALAAPIEFAEKEGFITSLAQVAATSDQAVKKDCAQIAQAMGFECESWDIDYSRVLQGMRTFCVNKTGYSYPENWLYAVTSKWEMDDKKLG